MITEGFAPMKPTIVIIRSEDILQSVGAMAIPSMSQKTLSPEDFRDSRYRTASLKESYIMIVTTEKEMSRWHGPNHLKTRRL